MLLPRKIFFSSSRFTKQKMGETRPPMCTVKTSHVVEGHAEDNAYVSAQLTSVERRLKNVFGNPEDNGFNYERIQ
jgi:hypothetical protein